jgi:hypothetical protein
MPYCHHKLMSESLCAIRRVIEVHDDDGYDDDILDKVKRILSSNCS